MINAIKTLMTLLVLYLMQNTNLVKLHIKSDDMQSKKSFAHLPG